MLDEGSQSLHLGNLLSALIFMLLWLTMGTYTSFLGLLYHDEFLDALQTSVKDTKTGNKGLL